MGFLTRSEEYKPADPSFNPEPTATADEAKPKTSPSGNPAS